MQRRTLAGLVLGVMLSLAAAGGWAAAILYEDKFSELDPGWGEANPIYGVKGGKLVLTPEAKTGYTLLNQAQFFPNDIDASVTVSLVKSDDPSFGAGLVFWAKDYTEYYTLLVNGDGWFAVNRYINGRFLLPVAWRQNPAVKKGLGVSNLVRIVTKGNQGTIFLNGQQILTFSGQPPQGGTLIGVRGSSPDKGTNTWAFANLEVKQP